MTTPVVDTTGAFVGAPEVLAEGTPGGPLAGRTLAVKDVIDVAGTVTGAGNPTFASFVGYSLLTAAEMPPVETAFVESPSPLNPLGAKGIGEGGAIGTPAAVANAVADALGGVRVVPPFSEDKLWRALRGEPA